MFLSRNLTMFCRRVIASRSQPLYPLWMNRIVVYVSSSFQVNYRDWLLLATSKLLVCGNPQGFHLDIKKSTVELFFCCKQILWNSSTAILQDPHPETQLVNAMCNASIAASLVIILQVFHMVAIANEMVRMRNFLSSTHYFYSYASVIIEDWIFTESWLASEKSVVLIFFVLYENWPWKLPMLNIIEEIFTPSVLGLS